MPDDMGHEQDLNDIGAPEKPSDSEVDTAQPVRLPQPLIPADTLMSDRGRFGFLSRQAREQGRNERNIKAEDDFGKDVERIAILAATDEEMASTRFNEAALPPRSFPDPEDLLNAYKKSPDGDKVRRKKGVSEFTETTIRGTLTRLTHDLRVLHLDQGFSIEEAGDKIRDLTDPIVKIIVDKPIRKEFGQQSRDGQMKILEDLVEMRRRMLRENAGLYFYHLSSTENYLDPSSRKANEFKARFEKADENSQLEISAKARVEVIKGMNRLMKANLARLRTIEQQEPTAIPLSFDIEDEFEAASLPRRSKLLDMVIERKAELTLPYLDDIYRLRTILEHEEGEEAMEINQDDQATSLARLSVEVDRIDGILSHSITSGQSGPHAEVHPSDMERAVEKISAKHNDSTLAETFQRVLLLRTGIDDIF